MTLIRHGQAIMTRITPHNANRRYIKSQNIRQGLNIPPVLSLPLITDLNGNPDDATFARADAVDYTATVVDYQGTVIPVESGEARFTGARRVDHDDGIDYGAGVLGVQYFDTDAQGGRIPAATLKGLLVEEASTNLFLNSGAPVTQGITTTAQDYTIQMTGTGSVTLSGTATGVCTAAAPLTVTATAGTLTCTVVDADTAQVEAKSYTTSQIITAGAAATRAADEANVPWIAGLLNDFVVTVDAVTNDTSSLAGVFTIFEDGSNRVTLGRSSSNADTYNKRIAGVSNQAFISNTGWLDGDGASHVKKGRISSSVGVDVWSDGIKGATNAPELTAYAALSTLYIGKDRAVGDYLNGEAKNLKVYEGDLTDAQVALL